MLFSALLSLLPLAAAAPVDLAKRQTFSGRATFYDVGLGACGGYNVASDFIVALNSPQFGSGYPGPNCGRSLTISYGGKTAVATVTDQCPGCAYGALDLSRGLFDYFASEDLGVFQMSWYWNDGNSQPQQQPTTTSTTPAYTPPTTTYTPPSTTPSPSPTPTTTTTAQAQIQVLTSSTTTAPASTTTSSTASPSTTAASGTVSGSASGSASASGSSSASSSVAPSASTTAAPGGAAVLSASDNNLAALASAVAAIGRLIITGQNGTTTSA